MLVGGILCALFIAATIWSAVAQKPKVRARCATCARPVEPTLSHCAQCGAARL